MSLGTLILILAAMFCAGCVSDSEYVFVRHASLSEINQHQKFLVEVPTAADVTRFHDFVLSGHRITAGSGTVIAWRSYRRGILLLPDQGSFSKLTVFVPRAFADSTTIQLADTDGAIAFFSSGSSAFPGHTGCAGYARKGSIQIEASTAGESVIAMHLEVEATSPAGWKGQCNAFVFEQRHRFREKPVEALTPWEGATGGDVYQESRPD